MKTVTAREHYTVGEGVWNPTVRITSIPWYVLSDLLPTLLHSPKQSIQKVTCVLCVWSRAKFVSSNRTIYNNNRTIPNRIHYAIMIFIT